MSCASVRRRGLQSLSSRVTNAILNTCTTEVLMRKFLLLGLASLFLVVTGCQDTTMTGPLAGPEFHAVGAGMVLSLASLWSTILP